MALKIQYTISPPLEGKTCKLVRWIWPGFIGFLENDEIWTAYQIITPTEWHLRPDVQSPPLHCLAEETYQVILQKRADQQIYQWPSGCCLCLTPLAPLAPLAPQAPLAPLAPLAPKAPQAPLAPPPVQQPGSQRAPLAPRPVQRPPPRHPIRTNTKTNSSILSSEFTTKKNLRT